jgi:hypothetical protein
MPAAPLPKARAAATSPPPRASSQCGASSTSQSALISDTTRMNSFDVSTSSWYTTHLGSASRRLELGWMWTVVGFFTVR